MDLGPSRRTAHFPRPIARCPTRIRRKDLYGHFAKVGLFYGPEFSPLQQISAGDREAVGRLCAPSPRWRDFDVHPGLLDGAIQLMMAAAMGDAGPLKLIPQARPPRDSSVVECCVQHRLGGTGGNMRSAHFAQISHISLLSAHFIFLPKKQHI